MTNPNSKLRILCVDDDEDLLRLMKIKLGSIDYELEVAHSCAEAKDLFFSKPIDVVLIDYTIPDGDGVELLKEFTNKKPYGAYIILTGNSNEAIAVAALTAGASCCIIKDISGGYFTLLPIVIKQAFEKSMVYLKNERYKDFLNKVIQPPLNDLCEVIDKRLSVEQSAIMLDLSAATKHLLKLVDDESLSDQ